MPEPIRLIQTGDLHLGSPFSFAPDLAKSLQQSQLDQFWRIISLCREQDAHLLLIAGDLFDQPVPDRTLVQTVIDSLDSLDRTTVVIAPGNHDPYGLDSPYRTARWPEHVHVFGETFGYLDFPDCQTRIFGVGFAATATDHPLLPSSLAVPLRPDFANLLLVHGDWTAANPQSPYNALSVARLSELGFDYVALGHLHDYSGIQQIASHTSAAYAGCPFGRGFDETGPRGVICGEIRLSPSRRAPLPGEPIRLVEAAIDLAFTPLPGRRFIELSVDLSACTDTRSVEDAVRMAMQASQGESYADHLYKVILVGERDDSLNLTLDLLQQRLSGQTFFLKLRDRTRPRLDLPLLAGEHSLRGAFVRLMLERIGALEAQVANGGKGAVRELAVARQALALGFLAMQGEEIQYAAE